MQQANPEIVVTPLPGEVEQLQRRYVVDVEMSTPERKRYKMEEHVERKPAGFLLTFPSKGHSIRVDEEELNRLRSRLIDPSGMVESEKPGGSDNTQLLRGAGGGALVNVIVQEKKGVAK